MNLHLDREAFTELVTAASHELHIPSSIIEKDYYVTLALRASEGVPGESRKDSSKGLLFPLWMRCSFQSRILKRHGADAVITVIGSSIQASIHRPWN